MKFLRAALLSLALLICSNIAFSPSMGWSDLRWVSYLTPNGVYYKSYIASGTTQNLIGITAGGSDTNIDYAASNNLNITRGGSTQWRIDGSSNFLGNMSTNFIGALTNDANDANASCFSGGGSCADTRGGYVKAYGNENATTGVVDISAGNVAAGVINFKTANSNRWIIANNGDLSGDSLSGNITISRLGKGISQSTTSSLTAAGSAIGDCLVLSRVYNVITTAAAGTGACLWSPDYSGVQILVQNRGANDMKLYPSAAGGSINGITAGNPITLATATKDVALCWHTGSNNWVCMVGPGKST